MLRFAGEETRRCAEFRYFPPHEQLSCDLDIGFSFPRWATPVFVVMGLIAEEFLGCCAADSGGVSDSR
jgi:hypothetical protein